MSTPKPSAGVSTDPSRPEPVVPRVRRRRCSRVARVRELLLIAVNNVDRVVRADADGQGGYQRCYHVVGDAKHRHSSQHPEHTIATGATAMDPGAGRPSVIQKRGGG